MAPNGVKLATVLLALVVVFATHLRDADTPTCSICNVALLLTYTDNRRVEIDRRYARANCAKEHERHDPSSFALAFSELCFRMVQQFAETKIVVKADCEVVIQNVLVRACATKTGAPRTKQLQILTNQPGINISRTAPISLKNAAIHLGVAGPKINENRSRRRQGRASCPIAFANQRRTEQQLPFAELWGPRPSRIRKTNGCARNGESGTVAKRQGRPWPRTRQGRIAFPPCTQYPTIRASELRLLQAESASPTPRLHKPHSQDAVDIIIIGRPQLWFVSVERQKCMWHQSVRCSVLSPLLGGERQEDLMWHVVRCIAAHTVGQKAM